MLPLNISRHIWYVVYGGSYNRNIGNKMEQKCTQNYCCISSIFKFSLPTLSRTHEAILQSYLTCIFTAYCGFFFKMANWWNRVACHYFFPWYRPFYRCCHVRGKGHIFQDIALFWDSQSERRCNFTLGTAGHTKFSYIYIYIYIYQFMGVYLTKCHRCLT